MTRNGPTADREPPERTLEEIQAETDVAADRLESLAGELALASLSTELERHFPADAAELERMGTGEVCPSVAFEVHGDLADVVEALGEAVDGLRKAASRTPETVLAEWQQRQSSGTSVEAMPPPGARAIRGVAAIQADVLRLAARTARLRADHLELVAELNRDHLPRGAEYDRMGREGVVPSLPFYLAGQLDAVESDLLRKVEQDLLEAAEKTVAGLKREFGRRRERRA